MCVCIQTVSSNAFEDFNILLSKISLFLQKKIQKFQFENSMAPHIFLRNHTTFFCDKAEYEVLSCTVLLVFL